MEKTKEKKKNNSQNWFSGIQPNRELSTRAYSNAGPAMGSWKQMSQQRKGHQPPRRETMQPDNRGCRSVALTAHRIEKRKKKMDWVINFFFFFFFVVVVVDRVEQGDFTKVFLVMKWFHIYYYYLVSPLFWLAIDGVRDARTLAAHNWHFRIEHGLYLCTNNVICFDTWRPGWCVRRESDWKVSWWHLW